jgi:hypothetical protein
MPLLDKSDNIETKIKSLTCSICMSKRTLESKPNQYITIYPAQDYWSLWGLASTKPTHTTCMGMRRELSTLDAESLVPND